MEPALTMAWNPCSASRGMSAHHPLETALTIPWNTQSPAMWRSGFILAFRIGSGPSLLWTAPLMTIQTLV
jgi:hypothetical protein